MSNQTDPQDDAEFEEAHSRLAEGLESCRSLLKNYKAVLGPEAATDEDPTVEGLE